MSEPYVYGIHAVTALLASDMRRVKKLFIVQDKIDKRLQTVAEQARQQHVAVALLPAHKMRQSFAHFAHQGIVALTDKLPEYGEKDIKPLFSAAEKPSLILILDGITDPHNLGACLRTADAAGVNFVIIPKDKSASVTPVVSKVACGAAESVPLVRVTNLVRAIEVLKQEGVWVYGAAGEADASLYSLDCSASIALVVGAEGSGMRRLTREHCDGLFALPMLGSVSSLNVSVATGISLYEAVRQRNASTT